MTTENSARNRMTALQVVAGHDLSGKTFIVTGGGSGLGLEAAKALASVGAHVVLAVRNVEKVRENLPDGLVGLAEIEELDLASLSSVRAFVDRWGDRPLDVLINNAGVMQTSQRRTEDDFEENMAVNHLGMALLTLGLTPALENGSMRRVVVVSSSAHRLAEWSQDDPFFETRPYDSHAAYGQSKSAASLFTLAYDDRYKARGIRANSLMPGMVVTPLMRHTSDEELGQLKARLKAVHKTPEEGAATIAWAAISPDLEDVGGEYFEDCAPAQPEIEGVSGMGFSEHIKDHAKADRLWDWTLAKIGVTLPS